MIKTLKSIFPFIQKNKKLFLISLLCGVPIALIKGFQAYYVKEIFDFIFEKINSPKDLVFKCSILCASQLLVVVFRIIHYGNLRNIVEEAACEIRESLYQSIIKRPYKEVNQYKSGELISIGIFDTNAFAYAMNFASNIFREPISAIVLLGVAIYHDWKLTLFVFAIIPIIALILSFTGKKIKKNTKYAQGYMADLTEMLNEIIYGLIPIKLYNAEEHFLNQYKEKNNQYLKVRTKAISFEEHSKPSVELVGTFALIGIIIFAFMRIQSGDLSTSQFISFVAALALFLEPVKKVNLANIGLNQASAASERIYEVLADRKLKENHSELNFKESIKIENLSFKFEDDYVLRNINLEIKRGQKIAIVGESGSGKSTLLNILLKLYENFDGNIKIDKKNYQDISKNSLREKISYIGQKNFFIHDSIEENIFFGQEKNRKFEDLFSRLELNFINQERLDGLILDGGSNFSGGQLQRLSLLRALNKSAEIYIFDEATSALDNEIERKISQSLEELLKNKTVISIAHRLSTVMNYDKIFLLKDGEIIESGSHHELISLGKEYKKLFELSVS